MINNVIETLMPSLKDLQKVLKENHEVSGKACEEIQKSNGYLKGKFTFPNSPNK